MKCKDCNNPLVLGLTDYYPCDCSAVPPTAPIKRPTYAEVAAAQDRLEGTNAISSAVPPTAPIKRPTYAEVAAAQDRFTGTNAISQMAKIPFVEPVHDSILINPCAEIPLGTNEFNKRNELRKQAKTTPFELHPLQRLRNSLADAPKHQVMRYRDLKVELDYTGFPSEDQRDEGLERGDVVRFEGRLHVVLRAYDSGVVVIKTFVGGISQSLNSNSTEIELVRPARWRENDRVISKFTSFVLDEGVLLSGFLCAPAVSSYRILERPGVRVCGGDR